MCLVARLALLSAFAVTVANPALVAQVDPGIHLDPVDDTFGRGASPHDLTFVSAHASADELVLVLQFDGPVVSIIESPETGIVSLVEIDVDLDPTTGVAGGISLERICPEAAAIGCEYVIALGIAPEENDLTLAHVFDVRDATPGAPPREPIGAGTTTLGDTSLLIRVPLELLGDDDGELALRLAVGTREEPTDCAPDGQLLQTAPGTLPFVRGDCAGDGKTSDGLRDALFLLDYLFSGGPTPPCLAACDANADGKLFSQIADAVYLLRHVFTGGPRPPSIFLECGPGLAAADLVLGCDIAPVSCRP